MTDTTLAPSTAPGRQAPSGLDRVTFEVLKNGFVNLVDQMSEQLLRTCYSFVIYCRDFSSPLRRRGQHRDAGLWRHRGACGHAALHVPRR